MKFICPQLIQTHEYRYFMKDKYKKGHGWCDCCDANIVSYGAKCKRCGSRNYGHKIKKKGTIVKK